MRRSLRLAAALSAAALLATACGGDDATDDPTGEATSPTAAGEPIEGGEDFTFGMILVGPQDDRGWSQAHYEAGKYVEEMTGGTMIVIDKVNTADRPETTVDQVAADMIDQGAQLVFATSDDMKDGILLAAEQHPDVPMIWSSGDSAWADGKDHRPDLTNLGNTMGRMEYGKWLAGCAAGLQTETGRIGYLGPLINDETRRLANSAYLGAKHCYEADGGDPSALEFSVTWIGFWFNIPGVTLDPTQVTNEFYDSGADVVISGIDTTEAVARSGQRAEAGEDVWAVAYDFEGGCAEAEDRCLGVPYFNWRPSYLEIAKSVIEGSFTADFTWFGPNWDALTDEDSSGIGWINGEGLTDENATALQGFIDQLASGEIALFEGPLNYQDGSAFLGDGEQATDQQIWYMPQLLEGMEGASSAE